MVWHSLKHKVVILTTLSLIGASSLPVITTREVIAQTISVQSQSQALSPENQSQSFVSQVDTRKREKRNNLKGNVRSLRSASFAGDRAFSNRRSSSQKNKDHANKYKIEPRRPRAAPVVIRTPRGKKRPLICRTPLGYVIRWKCS